MILAKSAQKLKDYVSKFKTADITDMDRARFAIMMNKHAAVQRVVSGGLAEAGRALNAAKIKVRTNFDLVNGIDNIIKSKGGRGNIHDMAMAIDNLGTSEQVNNFISQSSNPNFPDMIFEGYINSILSAPTTHVANTTGSLAAVLGQIPETVSAAGFSSILRTEDGVEFGEAIARSLGLWQGSIEGIKLFRETLKHDIDPLTKMPMKFKKAITAENLSNTLLETHLKIEWLR
jgi:hypothetical protein